MKDLLKIKAAICQLKVYPDKDLNLEKAKDMIKKAANKGSDIVILPEMFNCPYSSKYCMLIF